MRALDVERIRRDFPVLEREVRGKPLVYLDNAATSQKPRAMIERMAQLYSHEYARVEEGHTLSREATRVFEGTRKKVAKLIHAFEPREVVFCRGASPTAPPRDSRARTDRRSPDSVRALLDAGASARGVPFTSGYAEVDELLRPHVDRQ